MKDNIFDEVERELDCSWQDDPICPYCGHKEGDSWEIDSSANKLTCSECGKRYEIEQEFSRTFSSSKTCQPNEPHDFEDWKPYIKGESEYRNCKKCRDQYEYRKIAAAFAEKGEG